MYNRTKSKNNKKGSFIFTTNELDVKYTKKRLDTVNIKTLVIYGFLFLLTLSSANFITFSTFYSTQLTLPLKKHFSPKLHVLYQFFDRIEKRGRIHHVFV